MQNKQNKNEATNHSGCKIIVPSDFDNHFVFLVLIIHSYLLLDQEHRPHCVTKDNQGNSDQGQLGSWRKDNCEGNENESGSLGPSEVECQR